MSTMSTMKSALGAIGFGAFFAMGCASSAEPPVDEPVVGTRQGELAENVSIADEDEEEVCSAQYSPVVAAYIDYAPWHCEGWTGKVFCEYESLSSVYGPGWGTCQCYNLICVKRGRACRPSKGSCG